MDHPDQILAFSMQFWKVAPEAAAPAACLSVLLSPALRSSLESRRDCGSGGAISSFRSVRGHSAIIPPQGHKEGQANSI